MSNSAVIGMWENGQLAAPWKPTTLDQIDKDELFLEEALAQSPGLLGLESRRTGIYSPFCIFRQLPLTTPSGRQVFPDIVLLSASGHVVIVEAKRYVNPELRDRAVIAQIIDYASSFTALSLDELRSLFGREYPDASSWTELVRQLFPGEEDCEELADVLLNRIRLGELNLVIACDKVPAGLPEIVAGICAQRTLGFDLDLVEITPFVPELPADARIALVPNTRLSTQIVSRTAVTVTYRQGDQCPSTNVETTSLESIEANLATGRTGRIWTVDEVESAIKQTNNATLQDLFAFAKAESIEGRAVPKFRCKNPVFGFCLRFNTDRGLSTARMIFGYTVGSKPVSVYLSTISDLAPENVSQEFRTRLRQMFGAVISDDAKVPGIAVEKVAEKLNDFKQLMLWLKSQVASTGP